MKLSAPKFSTWLISVIIGSIGILQGGHRGQVSILDIYPKKPSFLQ